MVKILLEWIVVLLVLVSLIFTVFAQSILDDSLTINKDIGDFKYWKYGSEPHPSQEDLRVMEKIGIAAYNSTITSDGRQTIALVYVIEFKKLAYSENFFEKYKNQLSKSNGPLESDYKGKNIYSIDKFDGDGSAKIWQSGRYILLFAWGDVVYGKPSPNPESPPEQILDVYLEKYPINYFKCERIVYTQEMPPNGYKYVYDYDEDGCEFGRHLVKIEPPTSIPEGGGQTNSSESRPIVECPQGQYWNGYVCAILEPTPDKPSLEGSLEENSDKTKLVEYALRLERTRISLVNLQGLVSDILDYYENTNRINEDHRQNKIRVWKNVKTFLEDAKVYTSEIIKNIKDGEVTVNEIKIKTKQLKTKISEILDEILRSI